MVTTIDTGRDPEFGFSKLIFFFLIHSFSQYCTKRMQRIRKKLKFHHGARFKKKSIIPETVIDVRYKFISLIFLRTLQIYDAFFS